MDYTFSLIKPGSTHQVGPILSRIMEKGFQLCAIKNLSLTYAQTEVFYAEHKERPFFGELCSFLTSGPVIAFVLKGHCGCVPEAFRTFLGATDPAKADAGTLRKEFGKSLGDNGIHGSDSNESAQREIGLFFDHFSYMSVL